MKKMVKYAIMYVFFCLMVSLAIFSFLFEVEEKNKENCTTYIQAQKVPVFEGEEDNITIEINGNNMTIEFSRTGEKISRYKICNDDILPKR